MIDGPFTEAKELIAGYTILQVNSKEEALEWTKRFPNPAVDGKEGQIEVRQLFELEEFGPSEAVDRFRDMGVATAPPGDCVVRRRVEPGSSRSNPPGSPVINAKPRGEMTMINPKVTPVPDGMHTVTPHLICAGAADAIEFYKKAFNAVEVGRAPGPAGKLMHACIRIGDSAIMLGDEFPDWGKFGPKSLKGSPVTIHLYVEDVDAMFERAVGAGATIKMPLEDTFWGDRYGVLEDPFGHHWSVATHSRC